MTKYSVLYSVHDRQLRFIGHMLRNSPGSTVHMSVLNFLCVTPANSLQNKTWSSSNKLCGLHSETDRKENERTPEMSRDREAWSKLLVACVDPQATTTRLEILHVYIIVIQYIDSRLVEKYR